MFVKFLTPLVFAIALIVLIVLANPRLVKKGWKTLPTCIALILIVLAVIYLGWYYLLFAILIGIFTILALNAVSRPWVLIWAMLMVATVVLGCFVFSGVCSIPFKTGSESIALSSNCATNLNLRTGGEVHKNLDDGDAVMGTIVLVTRDNPSSDPVLFVIMPSASLDIEYDGKMFFTSDRFSGTLEGAVCLAETLHPDISDKIVIGSSSAPKGWKQLNAVDGWWTASTWLYQEEPIRPEGLTASPGIFVSAVQTDRDLVTQNAEVIYGQFWTETNPGYVVHVQVRPNHVLTIPVGWQGTYWIWTGDFKLGESSLQKRMIQATNVEVVNRDDILGVTLLACGNLPSDLNGSLLGFKFHGNDITWNSGLTGWVCSAK